MRFFMIIMVLVCSDLCEYLWENMFVLEESAVSVKWLNVRAGLMFYQ